MYVTKLNQDDLNMLINKARELALRGQTPWPSNLKAIVPNKRNSLYTEACRRVRAEIEADKLRIELAPNSLINKATEIAKGVFTQQLDKIATVIATSVANDIWAQHQKQLQEAKTEIEQGYQSELDKALDAVDQANKGIELAQQLAASAEQKAKHYKDINEKLQEADVTRNAQIFKLQEQLNQQTQQITELTAQLSAAKAQLAALQAAQKPEQLAKTPEPEQQAKTAEPEQPAKTAKTKKSRTKAAKQQPAEEQTTPTPETDSTTPAKPKKRSKATKATAKAPEKTEAPEANSSLTPESEQDPILTPQGLEEPTPKRASKSRTKKAAKTDA